jgi:hypothetical protein
LIHRFRQGDQPRPDRQPARRRHDRLRPAPPDAPYTYVTTKEFLLEFGLDTLRDLPDFEALEDAGLLSKEKLLAGDIPVGLTSGEGGDDDNISDREVLGVKRVDDLIVAKG